MTTNSIRLACLLLLLSFTQISFSQTIIYVNASASGGANDGSQWVDAYSELFTAINNASNGDQIWVAQGTYYPTTTTNRNISFDLPQNVKIYGGFLGNETTLSQRDWVSNITILSGDIGIVGDETDNSNNVFFISKSTTDGIIDGVTIQDGNANGLYLKSGGGMFISSYADNNPSIPSINNCILKNNYAEENGGAVYIEAGGGGIASPNFNNCEFQDNESGFSGGAVYNSGYSSGAITTSFIDCNFFKNLAGESGGALFNHGGQGGNANVIIKQCNFESNTSIHGHGGAMYNLGSILNGEASPMIINSRFFDNSGFAAGAIYNNGSDTGNSSPKITNCTFARNFTTGVGGTGGAIYANGSVNGNSSPIISNSIIWGNNAPFNSQVIRSVEGSPTIQYSLVDAANCTALQSGTNPNITCGPGMIYNNDPKFTYQAGGDLTLTSSSPAIDAGDNSMNAEFEDLVKSSRISNSQIDLGAYETASALPIELISFTAALNGDEVQLKWATANELNNDFFSIQHSTDGISFTNIKRIDGAGDASVVNTYSTIDQNPSRGINYYRLQQTDFDGTTSHSPIETVKVFSGKIGTYPNPVLNHLSISFGDFEKGNLEYAIFNIYGKEVHRERVEIKDGLHVVNLDQAGSFLPGTYIVKVFNSKNGTYTQKFQKVID